MRSRRLLLSSVLLLVSAASCPGSQKKATNPPPGGGDLVAPPTTAGPPEKQRQRPLRPEPADAQAGLEIEVRELPSDDPATPRATLAPSVPMADADAEKLLSRLPPIAVQDGDQKTFALRDASLPPPKTGAVEKGAFPPPYTAPPPDPAAKQPLAVLRYMPDGDVPLAPHLSVTFSQPMVPLTAVQEASQTVPVKLSPQPKGKWRWIGTKTLLYEPEPRFAMSTDYTVTIAAGEKSALGVALDKPVTWSFSTPTVKLERGWPNYGPQRRDPLIFIEVDQAIDPAAVLATTKLLAGGKPQPARLATADEIAADKTVSRLVAQAEPGRFLVIRPVSELPGATNVEVRLDAGTPSAEGPKTTAKPQSFSFRTYGPMVMSGSECGWKCPPLSPFYIYFSNPIDARSIDKRGITVEPAIPGLELSVHGNTVVVAGRTKGRTSYTVRIPAGVPDTFGQASQKEAVATFKVGSAERSLIGPTRDFLVVDPTGGPRLPIFSVNHKGIKVRLYKVEPGQYGKYQRYLQDAYCREKTGMKMPPFPPTKAFTIKPGGAADEMIETAVDLSAALDKQAGGVGHVVAFIEPTVQPKDCWARDYVIVWAQVTRLGLSATVDGGELVAWTSDLATGKSVAGAQLELWPAKLGATTAADGTATMPLPETGGRVLFARHGKDVAFLPDAWRWWDDEDPGGFIKRDPGSSTLWYVAEDRGLYRPGEEVKVKGFLRTRDDREGGDLGAFRGGSGAPVKWRLTDVHGNEVQKGEAKISAAGGFDLAIKLPPTMNLGQATLQLQSAGGWHYHPLRVEEFRRPEFEVEVTADGAPYVIGRVADVEVAAKYYSGGSLPDAKVTWRLDSRPGTYTPPGLDGWHFGPAPVWRWWRSRGEPEEGVRQETVEGKSDAAGKHHLEIEMLWAKPDIPYLLRAEATVEDVNRQRWSKAQTLLVHPAAVTAGLKVNKGFYQAGDAIVVDTVVSDLDGQLVAGRAVEVTAVRLDWVEEGGTWAQKEVDLQRCPALTSTSAREGVRCELRAGEGGEYHLRAAVTDERGLRSLTTLRVWVAGRAMPRDRDAAIEPVTLLSDKQSYAAGDTAELLVMAPWFPAEGMMTVRRSGVVRVERFTMTGPSHTLRVPVAEKDVPNLFVQVELVGQAPRVDDQGREDKTLPMRPAFASGVLELEVPPAARTLGLQVKPRHETLEPGGETDVTLTLTDAGGRPVAGGEVAVVVVDESVLALTGYRLPDPLAVFYGKRPAGAYDERNRDILLLAAPDLARAVEQSRREDGVLGGAVEMNGHGRAKNGGSSPKGKPAPAKRASAETKKKEKSGDKDAFDADFAEESGADDNGDDGGDAEAIRLRKEYGALALFVPEAKTGKDGRVTVKVTLPDSLTRYRVMAVAVAGDRSFGQGEALITARLPLMARPSPPRFLNFGDRFELPVIVQNQSDAPMTVEVAVRAANARMTGARGKRVIVPANDRVEVRFAAAAEAPGTARFQIAAASGRAGDAAELSLPVWTPATTEAFAVYGVIDEGAVVQPVVFPKGVVTEYGGIEITTTSTALSALTDAVVYLVTYPYDCAEQVASRVMSIVTLKDVLTAFKSPDLPPASALAKSVEQDLERLRKLQNGDGGWGFWRRGERSFPWLSIHVAHALARAQQKGFKVDKSTINDALYYLRYVENRLPAWYSKELRWVVIAYALYTRKQLGDSDPPRARKLIKEAGGVEKLPLEAVAWVYVTLIGDKDSTAELAAIRKLVRNRVEETAAAAHFTTGYSDGAWVLLHSDRRVDAVMLEALMLDDPKSDLIPKLVEGLLAHRVAGRWASTQENAFVLVALDAYFNAYEKIEPEFVARVWLGKQYAGDHAFKGRTTERHQIDIPMAFLAKLGKGDLVLAKEGKGRLYYRLGLRYAPSDLRLPPYDAGFVVQRRYEAVDDPADVRRDDKGVWHIRAGARVRVRLTMVAPTRRYHVALVDPLPAGLEPLNPALAVTGQIPDDPQAQQQQGSWWWWSRPWYEHQNMRDERVEAFATLVWEGVHTYTYVAAATTPGEFVVPPPKAEEMYHPETFGRGAGDLVVVE